MRIKWLQRKQFHHRIEGGKWGPSKKEKGPKDQGAAQPSWGWNKNCLGTSWSTRDSAGGVSLSLSPSFSLTYLFILVVYYLPSIFLHVGNSDLKDTEIKSLPSRNLWDKALSHSLSTRQHLYPEISHFVSKQFNHLNGWMCSWREHRGTWVQKERETKEAAPIPSLGLVRRAANLLV